MSHIRKSDDNKFLGQSCVNKFLGNVFPPLKTRRKRRHYKKKEKRVHF